MQPRRDKISGGSHLAGYLSVTRLIRANEAQAAKLMKKLQIRNKQEKQYGERLEFGSYRRRRRGWFGWMGLAKFRQ
jgi:hypothetical protein